VLLIKLVRCDPPYCSGTALYALYFESGRQVLAKMRGLSMALAAPAPTTSFQLHICSSGANLLAMYVAPIACHMQVHRACSQYSCFEQVQQYRRCSHL
jgi:hypothetical protein